MKKLIQYLFLILLLSGCNTWIGKQYVNTVARYNRIYHSQKSIRETDENIKKGFKDDFNKTLPLFNLGNESSLKGNGGEMDNVLKKTSRVIEKYPKSKWTDDAWFLMGQSYFYRGDFFAAIENFEYVSSKYKKTDIAYRANLWTLYCYILMDKESESLAIISKLQGENAFPDAYKKGLYICAAEIAIKQKKKSTAIAELNKAIPFLKKKDEKIRYNYILAQLYQDSDSFEQASELYRRVIKYNPPYDFNFNAQINLASVLIQSEDKSFKKAQSVLQKMLNDDKNIDYYGRIYYELGNVNKLNNNNKAALENYKKAVCSNGNTPIIKTDAYNAIGQIYYDNNQFIDANKYFDSANGTLDQTHPKFEMLSQKRENQSELLTNLVILQTNDSLLMMAENSKKLEAEIDRQIAQEKRRLKEEERKELQNSGNTGFVNNNPFKNNSNSPPTASTANGSFPFYDMSQRAKGANDFKVKWGDRKLSDNWRVSAIASSADPNTFIPTENSDTSNNENETEDNSEIPQNIAAERKKYYNGIPFSQAQKDKLHAENLDALFALGTTYIYDLEEPQTGIKYLKELQTRYPKSEFEDRVLFELAKYNKNKGNSTEYNRLFEELAKKYPSSQYLKVLKNELIADNESKKENVSKEVQELYNQAYESYLAGNYTKVISIKKVHDEKYGGNSLQSNFEYLEALTFARTKKIDLYKDKLESIISNYPNTSVSENAKRNLLFINKKPSTQLDSTSKGEGLENSLFTFEPNAEHYSILIYPKKSNTVQIKNILNGYHKSEYSLKQLEVTEIILANSKCIVVKGFKLLKDNKDYIRLLETKGILKINSASKKRNEKNSSADVSQKNVITAKNLGVLIKTMNSAAYLKFANSKY